MIMKIINDQNQQNASSSSPITVIIIMHRSLTQNEGTENEKASTATDLCLRPSKATSEKMKIVNKSSNNFPTQATSEQSFQNSELSDNF